MHQKSAFTLIELLIVIAIVAILAVVVVLTLNPAQMLAQGRDSNRISDMSSLNTAINLYTTDQSGSSGFSLGSSSVVYVSIPDPNATTTAGSNCSPLGLPTLPSTYTYHCVASSTYRNTDGTGWIPVNFSNISTGPPLGNLPIDPTNQSSSRLYYTYTTNGTQFETTAVMESARYKLGGSNDQILGDGGPLATVFEKGSQLGLEPLDYGDPSLVGLWTMDEGSGGTAYDYSGNNATGSWSGTQAGLNSTHYNAGKVGSYAGAFDGISNDDHVSLPSASLSPTSAWTISAWVQPTGSAASSGVILSKWESSNGVYINYQFDIGLGGSHDLRLRVGASPLGSGGPTYITGNTTMTLGQWYYVVGVFNGATQKLSAYVNGQSDATPVPTAFSQCATNTTNPYIGAFNFGWSGYQNAFTGSIDDLRIYNRALSAAEIAAMYAGGK